MKAVSAEDVYEQSRLSFDGQKRNYSHPPTHAFEHVSREGRHLIQLTPLRQLVIDRWSPLGTCEQLPRKLEANAMQNQNSFTRSVTREKTVHVRQYQRFRNGAWEDVCQHHRSLPR